MSPIAINTSPMSSPIEDDAEIKFLQKVLASESVSLARRFRALFSLKHHACLHPPTSQTISAIQAIASVFPSPSALLKHELAYCLGQTKNLAAVPYLRNVLEDKKEDPMCRHEAAEALGALGDKESLDILKAMRDDEDEVVVVKETCDIAISRIEWEYSSQKKGERLRNSDFASIDPAPPLSQISHRYSIEELQEKLLDTKLPLFQRYRAMFALRDLSSPPDLPTAIPAVKALASGFQDASALFRHEIAFVFGQLSHPTSIPSLVATLSNQTEESMVRHEAAEALGSLGHEEGVEDVLKSFLNDPEQVVKDSIIVALDMAEFEKNGEKEYATLEDRFTEENFSPFARLNSRGSESRNAAIKRSSAGNAYFLRQTSKADSGNPLQSIAQHPVVLVNGHGNGQASQSIHATHSHVHRPRLLTVDEALQFSPFSSIVPFSPDIIPLPNVNLSCSIPTFPAPANKAASRQPLELLERDFAQSQGRSTFAQSSLNQVQSFLDQTEITEFIFKPPPQPDVDQQRQRPHFVKSTSKATPQLGPFADGLLRSTDLAYRCSLPTDARPSSSAYGAPENRHVHESTRLEQNSRAKTEQAVPRTPIAPNSQAAREAPKPSGLYENAILGSSNEQKKPAPVVLIPPLSAESKSSDYVAFQSEKSLERNENRESRKRKYLGETETLPTTSPKKDQRTISDATFNSFHELVQEILDANDSIDLEGADTLPRSAQHFVPVQYEGQEIYTLAPSTQVKLESLLYRLISLGRIDDVHVDHLARLQGFCDGALLSAEISEIGLDSELEQDDTSSWSQRIELAELGLRSARTAIRIMIGGRDEKQLYSEELLLRILNVLGKILNGFIIPIVEIRPKQQNSNFFDSLTSCKKEISQLFYLASKLIALLVELLVKVEMAENIITAAEFLAIKILFLGNTQNEKDSVLGIQKFENLRREAMDMITQIFSRYQDQRTFLFDEILSSSQKLPTKSQHARQFKLPDGTNIQLVCALILRLIQTSAMRPIFRQSRKRPSSTAMQSDISKRIDAHHEASLEEDSYRGSSTNTNTDNEDDEQGVQRLAKDVNELNEQAAKQAQYIIRYFVGRAMSTSKSGDEPHRQLLDMLTEDLISVLSSPEWPAAELMLRALLVSTINIAEKKSSAPAKNMALELLGIMGSAISELVANTQQSVRSLDDQDSVLSRHLRQLVDDYLEGSLEANELLRWDGPYRVVLEYLSSIDSDSLPTRSSQGYFLTQWARAISLAHLPTDPTSAKLVDRMRKAISISRLPTSDASEEIEPVSKPQGRLAYALTILNMDFCRQFDLVFKILLDSISSEQTTVRTRSLKSVTQMLEKDPSLLDRARNVKGLLMKCALDASPSVRDSALMLIGKCIILKPTLEQDFLKHILTLANDPTTSVRKRSLKLLKDIYSRNPQREIRSIIADCLCQRTKDAEKPVSDLASQMLEESWLSPFWRVAEAQGSSVQDKLALQSQLTLIIKTVQRSENAASLITSFIEESLAVNARNTAANFGVCKSLVASAFECLIDPQSLPGALEQRHILQTLTVFASANAYLFTPEQLQYLQPYVTNLSNSDDLNIFKYVVVIFRCVLPVVSTVQHSLLRDVQTALLHGVSKLGRAELNEVAACLWTINSTLQNPEKLVKMMASVIRNLNALERQDLTDQSQKENLKRIKKYIQIAGYFGKHCNFESHVAGFREALAWWKGSSVSGLVVSSIKPFANGKQPLLLRVDALNGIGLICQAWPHHYNQVDISNTFQEVLDEDNPDLQIIVLACFKDFFVLQERQAEVGGDQPNGTINGVTNGKLGGSMTASESDGASALIAQRFLKSILRIASSSQNACAMTATEVIASINRQGLVHPKESGPVLVALETSTNPSIAEVAEKAHRDVHQQHESMFEREYMRAIQEAYRYQKDVVGDLLGYQAASHASKLHAMFEIIKTSKGKYQKKFISNFCSKIDFDIERMDLSGHPPAAVSFSRFLMENLAFFDYGRVDELLHTLTCMEKIVADSGSALSHSINTEVFHVEVDTILGSATGAVQGDEGKMQMKAYGVDPLRLRRLASGSVILSCLWETRTYLRRLYGLSSSQRREHKSKAVAKDINKVPSKVQGVSSEKLLGTIVEKVDSLQDQEATFRQCQEFVDLMAIDNEVKVAADGEESADGPETPSGDDADTPVPGSVGSKGPGKRKISGSTGGTPHKKRGRPSLGRRKSSRKSVDSDGDWGD
ncbi:MAG: hypothetical protein Q9167_000542 [Letrouitia subvulpina]